MFCVRPTYTQVFSASFPIMYTPGNMGAGMLILTFGDECDKFVFYISLRNEFVRFEGRVLREQDAAFAFAFCCAMNI